MIKILFHLYLTIYAIFSFKFIRGYIIRKNFDKKILNTFIINIFVQYICYIFCGCDIYMLGVYVSFVHFLGTIFFRKLLIIIYYKFYFKLPFLFERKIIGFDIKINNIIALLILIFLPKMYIIYILIISMFNPRITQKEFDEAILNKYQDYSIRVFISGKKKINKYKKYLMDPKLNIYNFDKKIFINDKNHVNLYWGVDFKFCSKLHNKMFNNHAI